MVRNLKQETLLTFQNINKSTEDIQWMKLKIDNKIIEDFSLLEDVTYDDESYEFTIKGVIAFKDASWLERRQDGYQEWWAFHKMPEKETYFKQ